MPLIKSASKDAIGPNITAEENAGKPRKQAIAIALDTQRRARRRLAVGGIPDVSQGNWWNRNSEDPIIPHGLVPTATAGRADAHDVSVPSGSYILPADIVSALGQGNTAAGVAYLDRLFGEATGGAKFAAGGRTSDPLVPVALSGGEYVVNPQAAAAIGRGNLRHGHDTLDAFVKHVRAKHVKTLSKLPGPVK